MTFALFFLAEYSHIILMSGLTSILFLGGWLGPLGILSGSWWFGLKTGLLVYVFIWIRGTFPRMRYDQLMSLIWKSYLPLSLGYYILVCSWGLYTHGLIV
jgi:NADH:ubiquinone oxidoreductase subunit H